MVVAVPFLLFNWRIYHSVLSPYYLPKRIGANPRFLQALAGNLISPARGLFVFSPVYVFSLWGIALKAKQRQLSSLDVALILIVVLHVLAVSSFPHWWGGHSFGPRLLADMTPYLMYLLMPAVAHVTKPTGALSWAYVLSLALLAAFSFFVHYRGANDDATSDWNDQPLNVDREPARIWDWLDLQFLRGVSVLDGLIPPRVASEPARIVILREPDDRLDQYVDLELFDVRNRSFRWEASPPPGMDLDPQRGEGAIRYPLRVTLPGKSYLPGTHDLGEIEVVAVSEGRLGVPGESGHVPIELYVVDELHMIYLPIALQKSRLEAR